MSYLLQKPAAVTLPVFNTIELGVGDTFKFLGSIEEFTIVAKTSGEFVFENKAGKRHTYSHRDVRLVKTAA